MLLTRFRSADSAEEEEGAGSEQVQADSDKDGKQDSRRRDAIKGLQGSEESVKGAAVCFELQQVSKAIITI